MHLFSRILKCMHTRLSLLLLLLLLLGMVHTVNAQRLVEFLDRGLVALKTSKKSIFLSWRLLATDAFEKQFTLYRQYPGEHRVRLTDTPLDKGTNFQDTRVDHTKDVTYLLMEVQKGKEVQTDAIVLRAKDPVRPYLEIPLHTPPGYIPGDASVADLNGDGSYEIVIHQTGKGHDNAHNGLTDEPILQAYKLDGTLLWGSNLNNPYGL